MPLALDSMLRDRYLIKEVIAQGGMGAIYLAEDSTLGVPVAIKENLFSSQDSSRQFKREATILAGLRHPNLPRVTDHFEIANQGQYLVMDYIDGQDLKQVIKAEGKLEVGRAVEIGKTICDALIYLHSLQPPVVHRDIKPGNIKITRDGKIFLVDFGLAKASQPDMTTTTGAQAFTPGYAPPEQYGEGRTGPASDIYALGATLYAALTATIPEDSMARALGSAELTPILHRNPNVPGWLVKVLDKAMAVRMGERYQSARELRDDLDKANAPAVMHVAAPAISSTQHSVAVVDGTTAGAAQHAGYRSAPKSKKPWIWIAITGGLILFFGMAGGFILLSEQLFPGTPSEPMEPIIPPTSGVINTDPTVTLEPLLTPNATSTPTVEIILTPEQSPTVSATQIGGGSGEIAYVSNQSGLPQIWMMNSDGSGQRQVTNLPDGACQVDWSPDGGKIVFTSPCRLRDDKFIGASIFVSNSDGSDLRIMDTTPGGDFEPAWSPLGDKIAFTSLRDRIPHIYIYDLTSQQIVALTGPSSFDSHPVWSPDGKQIAFQSNRLGVMQVWLLDLTTGSVVDYSPIASGDSILPAWAPSGSFIAYSQGSNLPWGVLKKTGDRFSQEIQLASIRPILHIAISPDSRWMAFNSVQEGNNDIFVITANDGSLTRLTDSASSEEQPAWRPLVNR